VIFSLDGLGLLGFEAAVAGGVPIIRALRDALAANRILSLYGIVNGWDWQRAGRLASTLGALKISSRGGQNHAPSRDRVATAYYEAFRAARR